MLTGKQKRFLRALGTQLDPVVQVGKGGISDSVVSSAREALAARELIKGRVLETAPEDTESTASHLAELSGASLVQVVGRNFLLYTPSTDKPKIRLP
jgi:RNA-binding protein